MSSIDESEATAAGEDPSVEPRVASEDEPAAAAPEVPPPAIVHEAVEPAEAPAAEASIEVPAVVAAPPEPATPPEPAAVPAPTIARIEPAHGPIAGGTAITVHGEHFREGAVIR